MKNESTYQISAETKNRGYTKLSGSFELKNDITKFFEFINFPILNTNSIFVKNCIAFMRSNNIKQIHYSTLKIVCAFLKLNWKTELKLMRISLKAWLMSNLTTLYKLFPKFSFPLTFKITDIINYLFLVYSENKHASETSKYINIYDIIGIID